MIRQFDICRLRAPNAGAAFVVVLQHDEFSDVRTLLVAPPVEGLALEKRPRLHPIVQVEHRNLSLMVERLAAINRKELGPAVGTAADNAEAIKRAIDIAFYGF